MTTWDQMRTVTDLMAAIVTHVNRFPESTKTEVIDTLMPGKSRQYAYAAIKKCVTVGLITEQTRRNPHKLTITPLGRAYLEFRTVNLV